MKKALIIGGGIVAIIGFYLIYRKVQKDNIMMGTFGKIENDPSLNATQKVLFKKQASGEKLTPVEQNVIDIANAIESHKGRG